MSDLVLYTHPMSRGRIARWMLEEVGQPYRTEVLEYGTTMKAPAYLAINPMGKVPAVRHGEAVVTEAAAICAYLADAFPEAGLAPAPGSPERAAYYRWLFFAAGPIEAAVVNKALGVVVPPERKPMVGYGSLDEVLDALEGALSRGDHILGERFSAAWSTFLNSFISSGSCATASVVMVPGATAFTRMPRAAHSTARCLVIPDATNFAGP